MVIDEYKHAIFINTKVRDVVQNFEKVLDLVRYLKLDFVSQNMDFVSKQNNFPSDLFYMYIGGSKKGGDKVKTRIINHINQNIPANWEELIMGLKRDLQY